MAEYPHIYDPKKLRIVAYDCQGIALLQRAVANREEEFVNEGKRAKSRMRSKELLSRKTKHIA